MYMATWNIKMITFIEMTIIVPGIFIMGIVYVFLGYPFQNIICLQHSYKQSQHNTLCILYILLIIDMHQKQQKYSQSLSKTTSFLSHSLPHTTKSKSRPNKTLYTELSISQPKLQNKKLKHYRIQANSTFFNHLSSTKMVQPKQLLDQHFVKFLDHVQKYKGFKGTKTHSWNQLLYLTPQKRMKNSRQKLRDVKKQLYQIIKEDKPEPQKQEIAVEKVPIKTTLVQFLTEYNPIQHQGVQNEQIKHYKWHRKPGSVIRQKLKNHQKKSQYRNKMHSFQMLFQGYKIP